MIAYGNQRTAGHVSLMEVKRRNKGNGIVGVGLPFVKCELDLMNTSMMNIDLGQAETKIVAHCLLLPHIKLEQDFGHY